MFTDYFETFNKELLQKLANAGQKGVAKAKEVLDPILTQEESFEIPKWFKKVYEYNQYEIENLKRLLKKYVFMKADGSIPDEDQLSFYQFRFVYFFDTGIIYYANAKKLIHEDIINALIVTGKIKNPEEKVYKNWWKKEPKDFICLTSYDDKNLILSESYNHGARKRIEKNQIIINKINKFFGKHGLKFDIKFIPKENEFF